MSRKHEIDSIRADIAAVTELLAQASEVKDLIGQHQFRARLTKLKRELENLESTERRTAHLALLFEGKPVTGSRGIEADFAGRVISGFQTLVSKLFAQEELKSLGSRGRVPFSKHTNLMITGVAHGSFGFVLDELNDQTDLYDTELKEMVTKAKDLIVGTSSPDESDFEEQIEEIDARALIALKDFFVEMDSKGAEVILRDDEEDRFLDSAAVHRARLRIESTEINESIVSLSGVLIGFLPEHRKFELRTDPDTVIYGSATKEAAAQFRAMLMRGINALDARCQAQVQVRAVTPLNRPERFVYRLLQFTNVDGSDVPLLSAPDPE